MEQVALRLDGTARWTYLGGDSEARKPLQVVVRAFDRDVQFRFGSSAAEPDGDVVAVPAGEGRRLEGRHFFAQPAVAGNPCRISYRGL